MSGNKELAEYIMDQLSDLGDIRNIPMMGGYIFYYRERIFGGIYGNGFLVKITDRFSPFPRRISCRKAGSARRCPW